MKNLQKIPRKIEAKFCWLEQMGSISETSERQQTPEEIEAKKNANYANKIDLTLAAIEMGANVLPPDFEKIPGSVFLKKSPEELRSLFIVNGVVDFRGNNSAYQAIGFSDLFPKVSEKQQFLVIKNDTGSTSYAYGARRSDGKIGYGNPNYKRMEDGVKVEFFIGPPKIDEDGKSRENFIPVLKSDKKDDLVPKEEFSYEKLVEKSKSYFNPEENLTPREERRERRQFRREKRRQERRDRRTARKYQRKTQKLSTKEKIPLSERTKFAINYFTKNGYTFAQAAGIIGNLKAESNLNPRAIGDGGMAYGIAQWHPNRQANFSREFGKDIRQASFEEQLAFILWELGHTERFANSKLKSTNNSSEAAVIIDKYYERSSGAHRQKRMNLAKNILDNYDNLA